MNKRIRRKTIRRVIVDRDGYKTLTPDGKKVVDRYDAFCVELTNNILAELDYEEYCELKE
jgi:hypothetical protein